ncbi:MAG: protein kinase [Pyrinomonadaceae bacterium]|nr:protein kinase [Pyrinomonadaceae bacterium]
MKPLAPDTLLQNRYKISSIIGKGGMGEVYLAVDARLGHKVALKRTTVGDDELLADAFENEARTLASLRHPVLPKVSDHFLENDEQFLVMEFIEGQDLAKRLKEKAKPFPISWVMFWADQLLEALNYLHTNDPPIIHRDIKPQNLKLTDDNRIVLLDFGLSKNSLGKTQVTTSGSVVGYTPHYAPMEQIRGTGTNAKSDIYALSATLYQLLTNMIPADALTRADALLANQPDPLRPLHEINPEISHGVSEAIMKGLDISQEKRFESAREMQKLLRRSFSEMQKAMSAKTVAFNVDAATDGGQLHETDDISGDKTEVIDSAQIAAEVNTATPPPNLDTGEPTGDKTEVLLAQVPEDTAASVPSEAPTGFETEEDVSVGGETSEAASVPDETAAAFDLNEDEEDFTNLDESANDEQEDESVIDAGAAAAGATAAGGTAVSAAGSEPPKEKSSVGKYIGILLGLGFVLIVVAGAAGGGLWYWSNMDSGGPVDAGVDPTPEVTESVEPTPESTLESTLPIEAGNENSNVNAGESPTPTETPISTKPDVKVPASTPRSTPVRRKTPVKRTTPKPRPTKARPKKTPKKKKDAGVL